MYWRDILTDVLFVTVGLILFVGGIILRIHVNRNRFYRRGPGGLQQFPGYSKAVFTKLYEHILMFISLPAVMFGFIILFFWYLVVKDMGFRRKAGGEDRKENVDGEADAHLPVPVKGDMD